MKSRFVFNSVHICHSAGLQACLQTLNPTLRQFSELGNCPLLNLSASTLGAANLLLGLPPWATHISQNVPRLQEACVVSHTGVQPTACMQVAQHNHCHPRCAACSVRILSFQSLQVADWYQASAALHKHWCCTALPLEHKHRYHRCLLEPRAHKRLSSCLGLQLLRAHTGDTVYHTLVGDHCLAQSSSTAVYKQLDRQLCAPDSWPHSPRQHVTITNIKQCITNCARCACITPAHLNLLPLLAAISAAP